MRPFPWLLPILSLGLASCFEKISGACENFGTCPEPADAALESSDVGSGGSAGASTSSGSSGAGGSRSEGGAKDAGPDVPRCLVTKLPAEDPCVIDEALGVFVSPQGNDAGVGTKAAPYKTFAKALHAAHSAGKRLYACDDGTGYIERITIDTSLDGVAAFGGFKCDWTYSTANRVLVRPPTGPALVVKSLTQGTTLEDFEFDAPDATAPSASSIGAIVDTAINVTLHHVKIVAGKGAAGQAGADGAKGDDGDPAGPGLQGNPALCPFGSTTQNGGTWSGPSICGSQGGNAGPANRGLAGNPGTPGIPQTSVTPPNVNNRGNEGDTGGDGIAGSPGVSGNAGAASAAEGTFSAAGYTPIAAGAGADGNAGQGGGGGGASNATGTCIGASGGAGGMGGCGGAAGTGGAGGGASIALLSWMSAGLVLDTCELVAKDGGQGGNGGNGGPGGSGKDGAAGGAAFGGNAGPADAGPSVGKGGSGGKGGDGGPGGAGAGGNGGPSYALVTKGQAPTKTAAVLTPGSGGAKGLGGRNGKAAPDGNAGTAAQELTAP